MSHPYLLSIVIGGVFGAIGSLFIWKTVPEFGIRTILFYLLGLSVLKLAIRVSPESAFAMMAIWTFISGWLASEILDNAMSDVAFEHAGPRGFVFAIVSPPLLVGLGWLAIKVALLLLAFVRFPVTITIKAAPGLSEWASYMAIALWVSVVAALPRAYAEVSREVRKRRARRS